MSCIVWAVSSTIEACKGGEVWTYYYCGGKPIRVRLEGSCKPSKDECSEITATASYGGFTLKDYVCNF